MTNRTGLNQLARVLAVAEQLSPHLNGPTALRLADVLDRAPRLADLGQLDEDDAEWVASGLARTTSGRRQQWENQLGEMATRHITVITVSDEAFPSNVAAVHDRPPLLFVHGGLDATTDQRAIAVVGARSAGEEGRALAHDLSMELARQSIVVVSGLAAGIDAAAHRGALAGGGRTIAVFGTGINRVYPSQHRDLAESVRAHGACVSQFWPDQGPTRWTFPIRNVVTSAFAVATVVVEASETSGAKLQAERALVHGKRVVLMRQLVDHYQWAKDMSARPAVSIADGVDDVLEALRFELDPPGAELALTV